MEKVPKGVYLRKTGKSHPQILVKFTDGSWKSLTVETEELAEEVKRNLEYEIKNGRWTEKSTRRAKEGFTLEVFQEEFQEYREQRVRLKKLDKDNLRNDRRAFVTLIEKFGRKKLAADILSKDIDEWMEELLVKNIESKNPQEREQGIRGKTTYSPRTIDSYLRHLKVAWRWAWKNNKIPSNELGKVSQIGEQETGEDLAWAALPSKSQIEKLREVMAPKPDFWIDSMNFSLWTGARLASIVRVKRTDLYYLDVDGDEEPVIKLFEKRNKNRYVPLLPEAYKLVIRRIKIILDPEKQHQILRSLNRRHVDHTIYLERAMKGYLFWEIVDKGVASKVFRKAREECGFQSDITFHSLRKFFGHYYLDQDVDLFDVSKAMGHSDIRVTDKVYSGPQIKRRIRAFRGKKAI